MTRKRTRSPRSGISRIEEPTERRGDGTRITDTKAWITVARGRTRRDGHRVHRFKTPESRCTVSPMAMLVKQAEITANDAIAAT